MITLIDLVFTGKTSKVNFSFLREFLLSCVSVRFNSPEIKADLNFTKIKEVIDTADYIDLVLSSAKMNVLDNQVPNVFVNLGIDKDEVELLLFFDIKDMNTLTLKEKFDLLKAWSEEFCNQFCFSEFVCRIDNGDQNEYFFDDKGIGPLYQSLK